MARVLLELKGVSKRYGLRPERRLRDATADTLRELCGLPARQGLRAGEFWALEGVDLRVGEGEVVGVIGHNGAGKSTLMNLVTGIVLPTAGSITLHTRSVCRIDQTGVLSLLETGRENIRMQLAMHGVPAAETRDETEAIASFADLHRHLDSPVGTYSAGMRGRLGFAIYARLHPDLFLVDEGIGGGDHRFRERFRGFIEDYVADGGSMLFCMHDTNLIQTLCDRVLVLDGGRAVLTGEPREAIDAYNRIAAERGLAPIHPGRRRGERRGRSEPRAAADAAGPAERRAIRVGNLRVETPGGGVPRSGERADVVFDFLTTGAMADVVPVVEIGCGEVSPLATIYGRPLGIAPPGATLRCRVECLALVAGEYDARVRLYDCRGKRFLDPADHSGHGRFRIESDDDRPLRQVQRGGMVHLPAAWETEGSAATDGPDAFHCNPYPTYARWLAAPGPFHSPAHSAWIVSRHDQVSALLRGGKVTNRTSKAGVLGDTMLAHDPPDHGRLRGLVADAFSPPAVRGLEERIGALVDELIDGIVGLERFDFIERFADVLPGRVMTGLLGLPDDDLPMLRACADMSGGADVAERNTRRLCEYFAGVIDRRRGRPGDDLVSSILAAHDPGGRASAEEVLATCVLLLLAGYETTSNLLGNGLLLLLRHPRQYARLREDPGLVDTAIEEMLRFESPTHYGTPRAATEPLVIGGQPIGAGEQILACIGAANRDPAVFPDPDRFDVGRTPNRHLAFGVGIHACPGATLSRTEARIALTKLNERLGELCLDVAEGERFVPVWRPMERVRGLVRLPVRRGPAGHSIRSEGPATGA